MLPAPCAPRTTCTLSAVSRDARTTAVGSASTLIYRIQDDEANFEFVLSWRGRSSPPQRVCMVTVTISRTTEEVAIGG